MDRKFYNNLPVHARYLDDQGILEHLSNAIQRQVDNYQRKVGALQYFQNPDTAPAEWLYYMQQWVGGYSTPGNYLGIGVDPKWSEERMRRFVMWAWQYWPRKGTQRAIREAIWVWLDFEKALSPKTLEFIRPFGDGSQPIPDRWFGYDTRFDTNVNKTHLEKCFLGGGDYPQIHQSNGRILFIEQSRWEYKVPWWSERNSISSKVRSPDTESRSRLGPRNVWMNAHIESDIEWNQLSPDIHTLNPEIWPILARPVVWLSTKEKANQETSLSVPYDAPTGEKPITYEIDGFQYDHVFPRLGIGEIIIEETTETYWWQPTPFFSYGDIQASAGGTPIPLEERSQLTEVVTEYKNWGAIKTESGFTTTGKQYDDLFATSKSSASDVTVRQISGGGASYLDVIPLVWSFTANIEESSDSVQQEGISIPWSVSEFYFKELKMHPIPGHSDVTPAIEGNQWWAPLQEITRTTAAVVPDELPTWGITTEIELPGEEVEIPGISATESNYRLVLTGASSVVIETKGQVGSVGTGYADPLLPLERLPDMTFAEVLQWPALSPWRYGQTPIESLQGILPIADAQENSFVFGSLEALIGSLVVGDQQSAADYYLSDIIPSSFDIDLYLDLSNRNPVNINALDLWQYPAVPDTQETKIIPPQLKEIPPYIAATYQDEFALGHQWMHMGDPGTPSHFEYQPILKEVKLLGIPAFFTRRQALNVQEIEIEDTRPLTEQFPLLAKIADADNWTLFLETKNGLLKLDQPDNFFITNEAGERSLKVSPQSGFIYLNFEFIARIYEDNAISSASLHLDSFGVVKWNEFYTPLNCHSENRMGFNFKIKMNLDK